MTFSIEGIQFYEKLNKQLTELDNDVNDFCAKQKLEYESKKRLMERVNTIMNNNNLNGGNSPNMPLPQSGLQFGESLPSGYPAQINIPSKFMRSLAASKTINQPVNNLPMHPGGVMSPELTAAEVNNMMQSFQNTSLEHQSLNERPKLKDFLPFMKPQSWGGAAAAAGPPQKPRLGPVVVDQPNFATNLGGQFPAAAAPMAPVAPRNVPKPTLQRPGMPVQNLPYHMPQQFPVAPQPQQFMQAPVSQQLQPVQPPHIQNQQVSPINQFDQQLNTNYPNGVVINQTPPQQYPTQLPPRIQSPIQPQLQPQQLNFNQYDEQFKLQQQQLNQKLYLEEQEKLRRQKELDQKLLEQQIAERELELKRKQLEEQEKLFKLQQQQFELQRQQQEFLMQQKLLQQQQQQQIIQNVNQNVPVVQPTQPQQYQMPVGTNLLNPNQNMSPLQPPLATSKPSLPTLVNSEQAKLIENIKPDSVYKPGYFNQIPIPQNQFQIGTNLNTGQLQQNVKSPSQNQTIISPTNPNILVNNPANFNPAALNNQIPKLNGDGNVTSQNLIPSNMNGQNPTVLSPNNQSNILNQPVNVNQVSNQVLQPNLQPQYQINVNINYYFKS